ncbi:2Fe-2S iron-sulfur cluster-binding protein [Labrys sp. ZIDIC5]|uniref:2Fe-2S iron-sulfur cluster-binding protein n=1 Tax=Labrys sedimenti TaxID=3106036 RepID=UPI002ACAD4C3|nr:2Fe-2S iron-sulfur cluster-binding protein [Labrys sp. ZIDIC5]MDZ5451381.1 2Fe-2S iron-sulfur cluster-binding protein [Labrys sp. ZIDIC5]
MSALPLSQHMRPLQRRLRLIAGLVLLVFVTMHLVNAALGLISIEAMEQAKPFLQLPWRTMPGLALLSAAAAVHGVLGLMAIAKRRSLALSRTDWVQIVLGLLATPLLINHILFAQVFSLIDAGFKPDFGLVLAAYWHFAPANALLQVLAVVVVWVHGAVGLYTWLVLKPVWRRLGLILTPLFFILPVAALLGFVQGGKDAMARLAAEPEWQAAIAASMGRFGAAQAEIATIRDATLLAYAGLVLLACGVMLSRVLKNRQRVVGVHYDGNLLAQGRPGLSLLEISLSSGIPHAHVCGGRGRCGTCVVAVDEGEANLSPIGVDERATLARIHAGAGQRLACQARLLGESVSISRLRPAHADVTAARDPAGWTAASAGGAISQPIASQAAP